MIQPLIQAMSFGQTAHEVATRQYWIHPALPEVIENALLELPISTARSRGRRRDGDDEPAWSLPGMSTSATPSTTRRSFDEGVVEADERGQRRLVGSATSWRTPAPRAWWASRQPAARRRRKGGCQYAALKSPTAIGRGVGPRLEAAREPASSRSTRRGR